MTRQRRVRTLILSAAAAMALTVAGPAPAFADTGIGAEYRSMGSGASWLGAAVSGERCGLRDDGCWRQYEKGTIHWSPATGARAQRGGILARWRAVGSEHGALGYPVTRERCSSATACEVRYQRGRITWTASKGSVAHLETRRAGSPYVLVNKKTPLNPRTYTPAPLHSVGNGVQLRQDAADAYRRMSLAAANQGVSLVPVSGFRSHATQRTLYRDYVARYGQAYADTISARPGYSEHQTGLSVDVGAPGGVCGLQECFAETPQGRWVAANGHRFGFVVRYPQGQAARTGYAFEPWHLRYVGSQTATSLRGSGHTTYEGYLGSSAASGY